MHQITLHALCRSAGGVESHFCFLPLSLMNSNPPVPSLLPLTYKFLIENPVSPHLFLKSPFTLLLQFLRYCCIMKSQTTLWAQSALLVFSGNRVEIRDWFPLCSQFWTFPPDWQGQYKPLTHRSNTIQISKWSVPLLITKGQPVY